MVVTLEGNIAFANAKMADISGYKLEELIGENAARFTPPEFIPHAKKVWQRLGQGRPLRERLEGAVLNKDGEQVPVEGSVKVIEYEGETALAVIVRDITERKRAEEKLKHPQLLSKLSKPSRIQTYSKLPQEIGDP
jgi:PAS domain S-box-containing protein